MNPDHSIIAIVKDKEYMFPCFDITKKNNLFDVVMFLAEEIRVCPSPESQETKIANDEVDSLMAKVSKLF